LRSRKDCRLHISDFKSQISNSKLQIATSLQSLLLWLLLSSLASASLVDAIDQVQPKMVKIYGAGGFGTMAAYQSGILISPEGHVLTVFSHVLDTEYITAVLSDGRKFEAKLLGADPRLEVAVLKIDAAGLPCFDLVKAVRIQAGARVLALSNIFGVATGNEPASVQKGTVSAVTRLEARRGALETPYRGPVYVLDVTTNNSGAAGGALVTRRGELAGMLGKELRNSLNNTWLNYAVPIEELRASVEAIRAGKFVARRESESDKRPARALGLEALGIVLIPDVLDRTPPYVDHVRPGSPAAAAGIRPDDLVLLVGDHLIQSCKTLMSDLESIDYEDAVKLTVLRGQDLIEVSLRASGEAKPPKKGRP
jgi:S1-C subfamily serine protease